MDFFKENFPNNVINDLYKFSKLPCIVNISSYRKEQFKLHRSLLDVREGGISPLSNI